jgi:hypothetical protein
MILDYKVRGASGAKGEEHSLTREVDGENAANGGPALLGSVRTAVGHPVRSLDAVDLVTPDPDLDLDEFLDILIGGPEANCSRGAMRM